MFGTCFIVYFSDILFIFEVFVKMSDYFSMINKEELIKRAETLAICLSLPVQIIDDKGFGLYRTDSDTPYCALIKKKVFVNHECEQLHMKAGQIAYALGESYIFSCHADLNHIAYPLVYQHILFGTIIIGPFLMDEPDSTLIANFADKKSLSPQISLELYDELGSLVILSPAKVKKVSKLTQYLFEPLFENERVMMLEKQAKLYQQSKINETIQHYKGNEDEDVSSYIYIKEKELFSKVRLCDVQGAKALLNDMLGFVLFSEGRDTEKIKNRAMELTSLLSRVSIEAGAPTERALKMSQNYIEKLKQSTHYEALCFILQEIVEGFIENIVPVQASVPNALCKQATDYILKHYDEPLSIQSLSEHLHISASYFSALFLKQMNIGFQEYLTRVRMEEAKTLLTATEYPLNQIALSVGYSDQSSFTKAFKRITGITPHQMRSVRSL